MEDRSLLMDALRLPASTARQLPGMIDATATAALSNRIAALLGGGHPNPDHQHQPPPRLRPPTPSLDLTIDGQAVLLPIPINADDPHAGAIPQLMAPLCLWLRGLVAASPQGRRVLVGVVGAAGAGKSYLCALLAAVLCRLADCEEEAAVQEGGTADGWRAVTLSMDAYHLPNAELEARGIKHLKGDPDTLDAAALLRDLTQLRAIGERDVALPFYDRHLHDPVPGGLLVTPAHRLVLVEGLHLLHGDDPAWAPLQGEALDATIFLDVPKSLCRERVVGRKVRNGRTRQDAEAHFHRVDEPIFDRLRRQDRDRADLVLHFPCPSPSPSASASPSSPTTPIAVSLQHRLLRVPALSGALDAGQEEARRRALAEGVPPQSKPRILTLGLNPCVQKVLRFEGPLVVGDVNRAVSVSIGVGGKGQNFAKAARLFGTCGLAIAQWLGGASGQEVERQLHTWGEGIDLIIQPVEGATRTCCSLLHRKPAKPQHEEEAAWEQEQEQEQDEDAVQRPQPTAGNDAVLSSSPVTAAARARVRAAMRRPLTPFVLTTEVIEPGVPIAPAEQEGLIEALCAYTQSRSRQGQGLAALTVMGSLPTGVAPAYYAKVLERVWPLLAPGSDRPLLFLDTVIGLDAILAVQLPVAMLKVNAAEARGFVGPIPSRSPWSHAPCDREEQEEVETRFCAAVRGWLQRHRHVRRLAVTSGPLRARLFHLMGGREDGVGGAADGSTRLVTHTYSLPFIAPHEIVNPIGAGDCCSAVTLSAMLSSGEDEDEEVAAARAFRLGLAAATASCCKEENSTYDLDALWAVAAAIRVELRVE